MPPITTLRQFSAISLQEVQRLLGNYEAWLDDASINTFGAFVVLHSMRPAVYVSSLYLTNVSLRGASGFVQAHDIAPLSLHSYFGQQPMMFNYSQNWEVAIFPINHRGNHWTVAIYDKVSNRLMHFDSKLWTITHAPGAHEAITDAVRQLTSNPALQPQFFEAVLGHDLNVDSPQINLQTDGTSCGYRILLAMESFLYSGNAYIPDMDIKQEIDRINGVLAHVAQSETYPAYRLPTRGQAPVNLRAETPLSGVDRLDLSTSVGSTSSAHSTPRADTSVPRPTRSRKTTPVASTQVRSDADRRRDLRDRQSMRGWQNTFRQGATNIQQAATLTQNRDAHLRSYRASQTTTVPRNIVRRSIKTCCKHHTQWGCAANNATNCSNNTPEYYDSGPLGGVDGKKRCKYEHCKAFLLENETSNICCADGKVNYTEFIEEPELLRNLFDPDNSNNDAKHFRENAAKYNTALQFASVSSKEKIAPGRGAPVRLINGQIQHRIGEVAPDDAHLFAANPEQYERDQRQKYFFNQLYILDPDDANAQRSLSDVYGNLNMRILRELDVMIRNNNELARELKPAFERWADAKRDAEESGQQAPPHLRVVILDKRQEEIRELNPELHSHRVNPANPDEVAAIYLTQPGDEMPQHERGLFLQAEGRHLHSIGLWNRNRDWLCYPLIFPCADQTYGYRLPLYDPHKKEFISSVPDEEGIDDVNADDPENFDPTEDEIQTEEIGEERDEDDDQSTSKSTYRVRGKGPTKFLSRSQYYKRLYALRGLRFNSRHRLWSKGILAQRFIIDVTWRVLQNVIDHIKLAQKDSGYRKSLSKDLIDSIARHCPPGTKLGKAAPHIAPSTFYMSRKSLQRNLFRSTTIRRHVRPTGRWFITMTTNQNWPEVNSALIGNQSASNRPDLLGRYGQDKYKKFLSEMKDGLFGLPVGYNWSMEHQKRGPAHWHTLWMFRPEGIDPDTPEYVDQYVSAEIPDLPDKDDCSTWAEEQRRYYQLVTKYMTHDCSVDSVCRRDGKCTKGFPALFSDRTIISTHDRPTIYRRRHPNNGGNYFMKKIKNPSGSWTEKLITNQYIVPHNRYLLLRFGCHICVKYVSGRDLDTYVFKYQFKGHEKAYVRVFRESNQPEIDESGLQFVAYDEFEMIKECAYLSAHEAYNIHMSHKFAGFSHTVMELSIHLPEAEPIFHRLTRASIAAAQEKAQQGGVKTHLNEYFRLCDGTNLTGLEKKTQRNGKDVVDIARELRYIDFPQHFRWDKQKHTWILRKRNIKLVAGVYVVCSSQVELFALRLLLSQLKGVRSFKDARTLNRDGETMIDLAYANPNIEIVDGREIPVCNTFAEAAQARGLMLNPDIWRSTLDEARDHPHKMSYRVFTLFFARLIYFGQPPDPRALYDEYCVSMLRPRDHDVDEDENFDTREQDLLRRLARILHGYGRLNEDFTLPMPRDFNPSSLQEEIQNQYYDFDDDENLSGARRRAQTYLDDANIDQRNIIVRILNVAQQLRTDPNAKIQRLFYLQGSGGCGKTYTYNALVYNLRVARFCILACASTGIAATHIYSATTAHSLFKIPLWVREDTVPNLRAESTYARMLTMAEVVIFDEVSMAHIDILTYIDRLLRDLAPLGSVQSQMLFGGKIVILGGDKKQGFPVVPRGSIEEQASASFFNSDWFTGGSVETLTLTQNMRHLPGQQEYAEWLEDIGNGRNFVKNTLERLTHSGLTELPPGMAVSSEIDLIGFVFPEDILANYDIDLRRAILCPYVDDVDRLNNLILSRMPTYIVSRTYFSTDQPCEDDPLYATNTADNDVTTLNEYNSGSLPPHILQLTVGCPVMLLRNLSIRQGLCNGTIMRVEEFAEHFIWCSFPNRRSQDDWVPLHRFRFDHNETARGGHHFIRYQFPLRPAFAITITKSQGSTFHRIGVHLQRDCFAHGMLYVALSRATSREGVRVLIRPTKDANVYVRNVVYQGWDPSYAHQPMTPVYRDANVVEDVEDFDNPTCELQTEDVPRSHHFTAPPDEETIEEP